MLRHALLLLALGATLLPAEAIVAGTFRQQQQQQQQQQQHDAESNDKEGPVPAGPATWEVPAKQLSACKTASEGMQQLYGNAPGGIWVTHPNAEQWRQIIDKFNEARLGQAKDLKAATGLDVQEQELGGVRTYVITPPTEADPDRLLVHTHGGAYVFNGGPAAAIEGFFIANATRTKVISVDYRMPPEHPYPAALDDAVAAWTEAIKGRDASKVGLFGTSAGGGLAMATVLRLKDEGKTPLPAALYLSTPWADLSGAGDSYQTLAHVDNMIVTNDGALGDAAAMYANGKSLQDPYISPIYGDLSGFPPTLLMTGTRDLFLSNTVRTHRKLRQANVPAHLHVFEGLSHAQHVPTDDPARMFGNPSEMPPEAVDALNEVAAFFEKKLGAKSKVVAEGGEPAKN